MGDEITFSGNGMAGTFGCLGSSGWAESSFLMRLAATGDCGSSLAFRLPSVSRVSLHVLSQDKSQEHTLSLHLV